MVLVTQSKKLVFGVAQQKWIIWSRDLQSSNYPSLPNDFRILV